ncbi:MAG: DNA primase [Alphaproteobacteria bacterium]|nr:DNA primase [Alphaproteobacteria bacterium]
MTIPPRFKDEIRNRLTLSTIIGKKIKVTRAGREFKACCPFHKEKSPSFYINDDKQFYHCFGCGAHGDVIEFVMQHDNLSFIEAIETLAAEAGLQVPKPDAQSVQRAKEEKSLHELVEEATRYFIQYLHSTKEGGEVLRYLLQRGLREETIHAFRIGFAPEDRQALRKHLKSKGFDDKAMTEAGLLKKGKDGEPYAFFRGRVMFPVSDKRGRVIAFGGRILPEHMRPPERGDFKPPKYINSSETPLFEKSRNLYAQSLARQAGREGKPILVTEGYMDVIACHQAGFAGAVAPMGTALTEEQILALWGMIGAEEKVPVLCFDGDNAGRSAAVRAASRILPLLKPNHSARIAFLPEGEDPDTLIKAGGALALQKVLDSSVTLFDFLWLSATAGRDFSSPEMRAGLSATLEEEIRQIPDREVQTHYRNLLRGRISETFFSRPQGGRPGKSRQPLAGALRPRAPVFRDIHERILTAAVINHPFIFETVEEAFADLQLPPGSPLDRLRQAVITVLSDNHGLDRQALQHHLISAGLEKEMGDILSESIYVHAGFASPGADSAVVSARWMELWHDMRGIAAQAEIRTGWKTAFEAGSNDEEEKLRNLMRAGQGENA